MDATTMGLPREFAELFSQVDGTEAAMRAVIAGLDDAAARTPPVPGSWSVAECVDHLARTNTVYLDAMRTAAHAAAHTARRGDARPGMIGRLFVNSMEPKATNRFRVKAPATIRPATVPLASAHAEWMETHKRFRAFIERYASIDLAGVRFRNPFVRGVNFSLATGLFVIPAHERRHIVQAARARQAIDPSFQS